MLYLTTRTDSDAFTANRALTESRAPDGGLYLPMRLPRLDGAALHELGERTFPENMAACLNALFNTRLEPWMLEFSLGRHPVQMRSLAGRIVVVESWHNPAWCFTRLAVGVEKAIRQSDSIGTVPSDWLCVATRIAILFGVFGERMHGASASEAGADVAMPVGDFSGPMAAWYARAWGLPIGRIIVCCNENSAVWSLLHKGELRTDAVAVKTATPECDYTVPPGLERLIFSALGKEENARFRDACRCGAVYYLTKTQLERLRRGIYVSVCGAQRIEAAIKSLYRTDAYIADPYMALAYAGLSDCRAGTGAGPNAIIFSEKSPAYALDTVAHNLGMCSSALKELLNPT